MVSAPSLTEGIGDIGERVKIAEDRARESGLF